MAKEESYTIQSVDRALVLLKAVASRPLEGQTLNELTSVLDIDRSSIFRLLSTLAKHDLVRQEEGGKRYLLGYGIYSLAGALRVQEKLTDLAQPFLRELVERVGENAHLAVRSRNMCVFIDREQGTKTLTANTDIGDSEELYCTAVGKSRNCRLSREELSVLFAEETFQKFTGNTITSTEALYQELQKVKDQGYAVDDEEYEYNVICLAGPVYNYENRIEAALGMSGPKIRMEGRVAEVGAVVKDVSLRLSRLLGYQGD